MPSSANLGDDLERYVDKLIASGRYESRSDVLRDGIRLIEERENRLAVLDAALERGIAEADAGRLAPAESVASRLNAKYQEMAKAHRG